MIRKIMVVQLGARMHYAVPRIFYEAGILGQFYTDIVANKGLLKFHRVLPRKWGQGGYKRLLGRIPKNLPVEKITHFPMLGLGFALKQRLHKEKGVPHNVIWVAGKLGRKIKAQDLQEADAVYAFNREALELFELAKRVGVSTILEQTISPYQIELQLVSEEMRLWPQWVTGIDIMLSANEVIDRESSEWHMADKIVCGSNFVREGIATASCNDNKCVVVPYGIDSAGYVVAKKDARNLRPLRVLTVGSVGLRKGSPYVLEVAKTLAGVAEFRMVGSLSIPVVMRDQLSKHVQLTGPVPRNTIQEHYKWADIFLLPSICEGSATVVYEALAHGLPVICTPNSGSVVDHGVDGFVVPIRDVVSIVTYIERLRYEVGLLEQLSLAARRKSMEYTVEEYSKRLLHAICSSNYQ